MTQSKHFVDRSTVIDSSWLNEIDAATFDDVVNVKRYGAVGNGTTDDTAAIQSCLSRFFSGKSATSSGAIYFPDGIYKITAPLYYCGGSGHALTLIGGAGGARSFNQGTCIKWAGTSAGTSMFITHGANALLVRGINFDGSGGSGIVNCFHCSADNVVNTTLSGSVAVGAQTATPASMSNITTGMLLGVGNATTFELVYVTGVTGATFDAVFTKAHAASEAVGGSSGSSGIQFRNCAFAVPADATSGTGLLLGNKTAATTPQISEADVSDCYFKAASPGAALAGVRVIVGGNVKNFRFQNSDFNSLKRGISIDTGSGSLVVERCIFGNITEHDIYHSSAGQVSIRGTESESATAHMLYENVSTNASVLIVGCVWQCAAPADDVVVRCGGSIVLINNEIRNDRTSSTIPRIESSNLGTGTGRSGITSIGNWYENATDSDAIFYDGSSNAYRFGINASSFQGRFFSVGDHGGPAGSYVRLAPQIGFLSVGNAMLHTTGTSSGITFDAIGRVSSSLNKVTVPYTAFQTAALTKDLSIFRVPARTKITGIIADTTAAFAGTAGTLSLRAGVSTGGQQLLVDHDVKSAPVTSGLADADLGSNMNRAGAIQGGYIPSWTVLGDVVVRLTSSSGNLSGLNAGSVTFYILASRML